MKCLVVDDSATTRRIVINALKAIGYHDAVEAADGVEALARCDASIEMVITDWNMPNWVAWTSSSTCAATRRSRRYPFSW
jgi:two-component system, chemotaxis family, chemotaxis protein CheY